MGGEGEKADPGTPPSESSETAISTNGEDGSLVMGSFVELLDRLLPPIPAELALREAAMAKGGLSTLVEEKNERPSSSSSSSTKGEGIRLKSPNAQEGGTANDHPDNALSGIQRQARRESMLIKLEAAEARRMREEDARMEHILLERQLAEELIREEKTQNDFFESYNQKRGVIMREEEFCVKELRRHERYSLQSVFRQIEERKKREIKQFSDKLIAEFELLQMQIEASYKAELVDFECQKAKDLLSIHENIQSKLKKEEEKLIQEASSPPGALGTANMQSSSFFTPEGLKDVGNFRTEALLKEYEARIGWLRLRYAELTSFIPCLQQEVNVRRRQFCESGALVFSRTGNSNKPIEESPMTKVAPLLSSPCPPSPSFSSFSSSPSLDHSPHSLVVLNAEMFHRTQASLFLNLTEAGMEASRRFHTLSFSLENIQTVDWKSLHSVRRNSNNTGTSVCVWVRDLDIGSNTLEEVALSDFITTFPSLRRISLSDNQITSLDHGRNSVRVSSATLYIRSVASVQQNAISERTKLSDLNIASNLLKDIDTVGKFLSHSITRLCAYANQLHSIEPLRSCLRLTKLELNRNALSDIEPLESLTFIQELNLCDNQITQISALSKGSWPLLEKLYLSNNVLTSLLSPQAEYSKTMNDPHCLLLSQLFVNYNRFTAFSEKELPWMPMLSVLQAEGNQLQDISGFVRCPRLLIIKLPFNQLSHLSTLNPLGVCKLLVNIDIRANPLMASLTSARGGSANSTGLDSAHSAWMGEANSFIALFRQIFPRLRELNNECQSPSSSDLSREPPGETLIDAEGHGDRSRVMKALTADKFIIDLRTRREDLFVVHRHRFHHAQTLEKDMYDKVKKCRRTNIPTNDLSSLAVEDEQQLETFEFLQKILKVFLESVDTAFDGDYSRLLRQIPQATSARAKKLRESQAGNRLAWWILKLVLCRRAVRELEKRKKDTKEKEKAIKYEAAVRLIQPVWRGAVLRSRLKRILHAHQKDLDHDKDLFEKVELPNNIDELNINGNDITGIIRRAVRDDISSLPRFEVDWSRQREEKGASSVPRTAEARPRSVMNKSNLLIFEDASPRPRTSSPPRDHEEPIMERGGGDGGQQWEASVALQIQKKRKKMERVHQQHLAEEFIKDPLKFKQKTYPSITRKSK
ncbi:unnamed protein product [Phytomonas sp. Hart1]|nr:unnamed protein product [Phytomonas sp. Hart1]|eukprot:CCW68094.1 unnamed protein product [Phytomonas sp. isolate Hart1]